MGSEVSGGLRILVVDDEELILEMVRDYLELLGAEVYTAENGHEGVAAYERHRPNAIITDIKMPVMDGLRMTARIRELDPDVPVFVLSGHIEPDMGARYADLRFARVFVKPARPSDIRDALEDHFPGRI